jgi:Mn2+/Fe2+ NRAMP family transporter
MRWATGRRARWPVLGASAVTLATSYAVGDYFGLRHSLHRRWREARTFHRTYAACVLAAAAVVLIPQVPLGLLTTAVQALAGVLLPSATVFLLLLCNDREVLGPLVNPRWLNVLAATVIGALLGLSVLLTATTIVPRCYLLAAIIVLAVRAIQVALGAG